MSADALPLFNESMMTTATLPSAWGSRLASNCVPHTMAERVRQQGNHLCHQMILRVSVFDKWGWGTSTTATPKSSGSVPNLTCLSPRLDLAPKDFGDQTVDHKLPIGTVTLLMADIEGSTRIWETQPEEMAAALANMDRTLAELVRATHGVCPIEQGEGDSFVVAFTRPIDAVTCALALQKTVLLPIRLRIAVHTGEVQLRDKGKYMGPTINRGARLRELAHGGQTLLSGATSELVCELLQEHAWLVHFGWRALRDLSRPEYVSQLCHSDLRNDFPPLRNRLVRVLRWRRCVANAHAD